jgi:uncharacterized protein YecT (DUF1311 family)
VRARIALSLVLLLLLLAIPALAGDIKSEEEAAKVCGRVASFTPPVATEADRKEFANEPYCADYIYRLAGDEYDPVKARRCCVVKGDCNRELAIIFANGWGVKRDYDAATWYMCHAPEGMAPFEVWGMLGHIEEMRDGRETKDLTFCEHATSGRGQLFCAQLDSARQTAENEPRIAAIATSLAPPARSKFDALRQAAAKFADAESGLQADGSLGGTGYAAIAVDAQSHVEALFVEHLTTYAKNRAPGVTDGQWKKVDRALNETYARTMKSVSCPLCNDQSGAGSRQALREAQRAWIAWRDAWTAFYAARWEGVAPAATLEREIRTALTQERVAELQKLDIE